MRFINEVVEGYRSAQGMAQQLQIYRFGGANLGSSLVPGDVLDGIERQLSTIRKYTPAEQMGSTFYSVLHPLQTLRDSYDRTDSIMNEGRPI